MARKNPKALTWILLLGGVGLGVFLFMRSRKKAAAAVPEIMTAPAPGVTGPTSPSLPIQIMTAKVGTHVWVARADGSGYWKRRTA